MQDLSFWVVMPSLLAIVLAVWTRQVFVSLFAGIWLGACLLLQNPLLALADSIERVVAVLSSAGDARVVIFTLCVGGLIALLESSGGVRGFVHWLERRQWAQSGKHAQWLAWLLGVVIFIESNITVLVAGTTAKPLFDRFKISRAKLAYLIDSTSAPICILIPFNAWGAFNLGLLSGAGVENPLQVFLQAVLLNLYAIFAVLIAAGSIHFNVNIGPMAKAEAEAKREVEEEAQNPAATLSLGGVGDVGGPLELNQPLKTASEEESPSALGMVLPIVALVLAMPLGLWITGDGDLLQGSGSTSVLWAVLLATLLAGAIMWRQKIRFDAISQSYFTGAGKMVPVALVLMLALALGTVSRELQAGVYIASALQASLPSVLILPAVFLLAAAVAFAIGSSWGTFSLMVPIAVQMAGLVELPPAMVVAAVLSGGVFGDHASPISDTTVIASMAAEVDHIEHVRTQLPYALIAGLCASLGFVIMGVLA